MPTTTITSRPVIERTPDGYTVWLDWNGVDRPRVHGISTGHDKALADRLLAAVESGAVWEGTPTVGVDVNGATYVQARAKVMGKYLNADLTALGY